MIASTSSNHWEDLFEKLAPRLVLFACQYTLNRADAEELVQDAFVKCWKKQIQEEALYFTAVRTLALDHLRSGRRRANREREAAEHYWSASTNPVLSDEVTQALAKLPEAQRQVVVLKIWGDLTFAEIAGVLDLPANTVASRYRYAMQSLRQALLVSST